MITINITSVRPDWYIATLKENEKITQGFGKNKIDAVNDLIKNYNK